MKKLNLILLILVAITIIGCGKGDHASATESPTLTQQQKDDINSLKAKDVEEVKKDETKK